MDWKEYLNLFEDIIEERNSEPPYDKEDYVYYTQLNKARTLRWLKKKPLNEDLIKAIENISVSQKWILITEPWCGDAAHINPIIYLLSELNSNITLEIVLRDSNNLIDLYLTNGSKSIPKLVVRDLNDTDLFDWGPRPEEAQAMVMEMKSRKEPYDNISKTVQNWYNKNKSQDLQNELRKLFSTITA